LSNSEFNSIAEILGANGALASTIKGFRVRSAQIEMAEKISESIGDSGSLIVESGTGTGKTFAYLAPVILSGKKTLISTGTRHLQDQIFQQDLPAIAKAMKIPRNFALLKGRSNYLCIYRLHRAALEGRFRSRSDSDSIHLISEWSGLTKSGDISEVESVPEDSMLWPMVTSTVDNCIGAECEHYSECFVVTARRKALEADIVVINHHLFFADLLLQEEGFGRLLPNVDTVIFDEAHQLVDTASRFFSKTISSFRVRNLCRDVIAEERVAKSAVKKLEDIADSTEKAIADFRLAFGKENIERGAWSDLRNDRNSEKQLNSLENLNADLIKLHKLLEVASPASKGLANCYRRSTEFLQILQNFSQQEQPEFVSWFEMTKKGFNLHVTPVNIAEAFQEITKEQDTSWVFVSATLAVNKKFTHFQTQLGLLESETGIWDSQ
jgi:ATP-dependent DNA helicase DinG